MGCQVLLQGIFPTQGSNPSPLHCRRILLPNEPPGNYHVHPSKLLFVIWMKHCSLKSSVFTISFFSQKLSQVFLSHFLQTILTLLFPQSVYQEANSNISQLRKNNYNYWIIPLKLPFPTKKLAQCPFSLY